ncbi:MAG: class I SAM-dependent methyltransferase [Bdellovibrionaceae bacterium]|nr:class I SAM-dependent methyltransferase [Bdellovibrionales bacterium]MCB9085179.1 class I SAM-dependent methyltransferase [Pseudobdellovibrionaceae bacterium]
MEGHRHNPTGRFSDRVENYIKYRPGYPAEIIKLMQEEMGLETHHSIADVGSGTGIFSELLLKNGNRVYAIEPNQEMRMAAERLLHDYQNFHSISGSSEATGLESRSVEVVTAAQAFHWFEPEATGKEFSRILRPGGHIMFVWNDRKTEGEFAAAYEDLIVRHSTDYEQINHRNISAGESVTKFFGQAPSRATFANFQEFDFEGFKGRLVSSSYIPNQDHPGYPLMIKELKDLFDKHQTNGVVRIDYQTEVFWSQPD